jgi:hypothetical protein
VVAAGHRLFETAKLVFGRGRLACASDDVGLEGEGAVERRSLVVERHARPLRERELAAVDRRLPGEHAEERRLAGAVWTEQGKTITAADRERNLLEERLARKFLAETRGNDDGHSPIVAEKRWREPTIAQPALDWCRAKGTSSARTRRIPQGATRCRNRHGPLGRGSIYGGDVVRLGRRPPARQHGL